MRGRVVLAFFILFLGWILWDLLPRHWTEEPTTVLGVHMGWRLEDALPECTPKAEVLCFQRDGSTITLGNAPGGVGTVHLVLVNDRIAFLFAPFSPENRFSVRQNLIARYGQPQHAEIFGEHMNWKGKHLEIEVVQAPPGSDAAGFIYVTDLDLPIPAENHINPF